MSYKAFLIAGAAATSLVMGAWSVHAQDEAPKETVHFADLDLSTVAGGHALMARIKVAAERVCGPMLSPLDSTRWGLRYACIHKGVADAVADAHSPMLTAIYQGRQPPTTAELAQLSAAPSYGSR